MTFALSAISHYHLVGIGGAGLSAIARILLQRGFTVSGSDRAANAQTQALAAMGAQIALGHDAAHIAGAGALIVTSAARADNPEIAAARAAGIPVFKRSDMIAGLMAGKHVIAVAGTHGKTTTTAMIAHILRETGRRPSYLVGGVLRGAGTDAGASDNAAWDETGRSFVIEADEYDHMFLGLRPDTAVLTNIEWDHPDFFTDEMALVDAFARFVALLPTHGSLIACGDSPLVRQVAASSRAITILYGQAHSEAGNQTAFDALAQDIRVTPDGTSFHAHTRAVPAVEVRLKLPGAHNALNALAAMLAAHQAEEVAFADSARALATFAGTGRRFEVRGELHESAGQTAGQIAVIDDYAHHPTAIRATITAARAHYPDRALWVVWQPHTFSRTAALWGDYVAVLGDAASDGVQVLVTDIFAARETGIEGVTSARLVLEIGLPGVRHTPTLADTAALLVREVAAPAAILILSAGDAPEIGIEFLRQRSRQQGANA